MTKKINNLSIVKQGNCSVFSFLIIVPRKKIANRIHIIPDIGVRAIVPKDNAIVLPVIFKNGINKIRREIPKRIFCMESKIKKRGRIISVKYIAEGRKGIPKKTGNSSKTSRAITIDKKI